MNENENEPSPNSWKLPLSDDAPILSSLLPAVMQRLGLDKQGTSEQNIDTLLADLQHHKWYVRANTARQLGKLKQQVPVAPLLTALNDTHESVRVAAMHALMLRGEQLPVETLTTALNDRVWYVREIAVLSLGAHGGHSSRELLSQALYDENRTVREAAAQALLQEHPDALKLHSSLSGMISISSVSGKSTRILQSSEREQMKAERKVMQEKKQQTKKSRISQRKKSPSFTRKTEPHTFKRNLSASLAVAVVFINIIAWSVLTQGRHTPLHTTQIGNDGGTHVNKPLGSTLYTYTATSPGAYSFAWSPNNKRIAITGNVISVWDATTGKHTTTYHPDFLAGLNSVKWSPDGTKLLGSDTHAQIWDVKTKRMLVTYTPMATPSSRVEPVSRSNPKALLKPESLGDMIYDSAWSPDGRRVVSAVVYQSIGIGVQVWDAATGQHIFTFPGHASAKNFDLINIVTWSPDGKRIAFANTDGTIEVWNALTGLHLITYHGHVYHDVNRIARIGGITWSPDSKYIASISDNAQVWYASTGHTIFTYRGTDNSAGLAGEAAISWSPDGRRIASAGRDEVHIWDALTGQHVFTYEGHKQQPSTLVYMTAVIWSPNGQFIASLNGLGGASLNTLKVWVAE